MYRPCSLFVFPTNLHCSQTPAFRVSRNESLFSLRIYTALKLMALAADSSTVCFPYEFTLLSNINNRLLCVLIVCFPYEFTLLSNTTKVTFEAFLVCFPYEFTLLSNTFENIAKMTAVCFPYEFTLLSNYIHNLSYDWMFVFPTNLHCSQTHI